MIDEKLSWLWAYNEQLGMLDRHDARWIGLSQSDWPDEEFARFLRTYRLVRGPSGKLVFANSNKDNRAEFYRICKDVFRQEDSRNTDLGDADRIWKLAVKATNAKFGDGIRLYSAVSKLLWFYRPDSWIMFDSLNRAALAAWLKSKRHIESKRDLTAATFTSGFQRFYEDEGQQGVKFAAGFFSRVYPYNRRVAEKYLWLMGLKEEDRILILASYRSSLMIAPDKLFEL
jgi:hypothetical protein